MIPEHAGVGISKLRTLHLGGGFASRLSMENAIWTGLIPEMPLDRIHEGLRLLASREFFGKIAIQVAPQDLRT